MSLAGRRSQRMMKQAPPALGSRRHGGGDDEFHLTEWGVKAKISRENSISRRFSASHMANFREDTNRSSNNNNAKSFRSNITISSTASSPGFNFREEIDPSTYSFTTALKALQSRTVYRWEYMSQDHGLALNSKWNDAEKYICNPLSGEVPLECLSAKTLSGRSFPQLTSRRISMSAPLIYPPRHLRLNQPNIPIQEKKCGVSRRDVGTQSSSPPYVTSRSCSPTPAPTPSIQERSIKRRTSSGDESPSSTAKANKSEEDEKAEEEVKGKTREEEEITRHNEWGEKEKADKEEEEEDEKKIGRGCLSWRRFLWMRKRQRHIEKHRPRKKKNSWSIFLCPIHEW